MALPSSGPLSLLQIAQEFGGSAPHSLSEYYGVAPGIPASGAISIGQFYGKANQFILNITANVAQPNIRQLAINAGWNGARPLVVNITAALINSLDLGTVPFAGGIRLNVSAATRIGGAAGGQSSTSGITAKPGTFAFKTRVAVVIDCLGIISGGGGGGSAGADRWVTYTSTTVSSDDGYGGAGQGFTSISSLVVQAAAAGQTATKNTYSGAVLGGDTRPWAQGAKGGAGGSWGVGGAKGEGYGDYGGSYGSAGSSWPASAGGAAGPAVDGNSYVTWLAVGTRLGSLVN